MARSSGARPGRTLAVLGILIALMAGILAAGVKWSDASFSPKLALDLAGGTQIVLEPKVTAGQGQITDQTINDAIAIIRQRVNASGVSEAEVSSQGGRNIVVDLPGSPQEQAHARELVRQSAQMRFRPVLIEAAGAPQPDTTATPAPTGGASPAPTDGSTAAPTGGETAAPAPTATTDGRAVPQALAGAAAPTPAPTDGATPAPAATPSTQPTSPSDLAWLTPEVQQEFAALDCSDPANRTGGAEDDPTKALVTCSQDGQVKYVLGPVEVEGKDLTSANAGLASTSRGVQTNQWVVQLKLDREGAAAFRDTTQRLVGLSPPQNQFAVVLDGLVITSPQIDEPIPNGEAEIRGSFTQQSAQTLANQLKFGALPISFTVQTEDQISALLGAEQLQRSLLAGLIGLGLVVVYSLLQYRALGLVTVASLVIAGVLTYLSIALLSWYQGYRLSLPGVAGLIVAIGITVDSFIVYFERVRDEVREGRGLLVAVENGWKRARRTILASDTISFLAAVVLFLLAVGGVRGFAFTLGLTTVIDLAVVFLFTHPMLALLSRTRFFGGGHPLSGFDPVHLGREVAYAGRGRVRTGPVSGSAAPAPVSSDAAVDAPAAGAPAGAPSPAGPRQTLAQRKAASRRAEAARRGAPPGGAGTGPDGDDQAKEG